MKALVASLLFSLTNSAPCARPIADLGGIEYVVGDHQISLLDGVHHVTLPKDVPCSQVVETLAKSASNKCSVAINGQSVDGTRAFSEVVGKSGSAIVCGAVSTPFLKFTPVVDAHELPSLKEYLAANAAPKAKTRKWPMDSRDIVGSTLTGDIKGYAEQFLKTHWGPVHPFLTYNSSDTGVYHLNNGRIITATTPATDAESSDEVRISLVADWGSGTKESAYVAKRMVEGFNPHYTLHAGDVYYIGTPDEIKSNCLGIAPENCEQGVTWPIGSLGSFIMMGNHEMYSRAYGFYDYWLPALGIKDKSGKMSGQKATYSSLQNSYWRVINLDTGYNSYSQKFENDENTQPPPVIDWLRDVVKLGDENDHRGILLLSHHQYFSGFAAKNISTATPAQIAALLPPQRTVVWLWGHEHRLSFYGLNSGINSVPLTVYGRCIGNGGFPTTVEEAPPRSRYTNLILYDDRMYEFEMGSIKKIAVGFNGWTRLSFKKNVLSIDYYSLALGADGEVTDATETHLVHEEFTADSSGSVVQSNWNVLEKNLTAVNHAFAPQAAIQ